MARKILAGLLALWIPAAPAAFGAAPRLPGTSRTSLKRPLSIGRQAPSLVPIAPRQVARALSAETPEPDREAPRRPEEPAPSSRARLDDLAQAANHEQEAARAFDGRGGGDASSAVPASPESAANPGNEAPTALAKAPAKPNSRGFKTSVAVGIAAAVAAPILWDAAPPLMAAYTGTLASLEALRLWGFSKLWRWASRRLSGRSQALEDEPASRARLRPLKLAAGLALGLALGASPAIFRKEIVQGSSWVLASKRQVRPLGKAFEQEVVLALLGNEEGRRLLDGLRDRGGAIRLPDFYLANMDDAGGLMLPLLDAVFLDPARLRHLGYGPEELLQDEAKQRRFARNQDVLIFHELYHALQFRKAIQPGQLERFPRQLHSYFAVEREYEALFHQFRYIQSKLEADPLSSLTSNDLGDYKAFLDDMEDHFRREVDDAEPYKGLFVHVRSRHYEALMKEWRARWPALSRDGFMLLARREELSGGPSMQWVYQELARRRALEHGIAPPEIRPIKGHPDWTSETPPRRRHAPSGYGSNLP